jgi:hypothetical protein
MLLLTQFLLRMSFGLAAGMILVPARHVTSGYYRNNLYVILGLTAAAALLFRTLHADAVWIAAAATALSYVAAVCWLYEKSTAGKAMLLLIAITALYAAESSAVIAGSEAAHQALRALCILTSGLTLGVVTAAMLLGHWYLNAPGMKIAPLKSLLLAAAIVVAVHAVLCGYGAVQEHALRAVNTQWWLFLALRWLFGLLGPLALFWMAWRTLNIPNTQSATGILYVAVIGVFVGETMSLLLSAESLYPL